MTGDKCKGCPYYQPNLKCDGCGEHWAECYSDKKHKDFMNLLDEIDRERRG